MVLPVLQGGILYIYSKTLSAIQVDGVVVHICAAHSVTAAPLVT